jgi:hypothetical protein
MDRITQKGIDYSLELLNKGGYLTEPPTDWQTLNLLTLIDACEKFIEDSKKKGDARDDLETADAVLIFLFQHYLKEQLFIDLP